ncbi:MAG: hypothetical protein IPM17_04510 [Verrucomicrobia bacterium]|nr:hypothetical protein [Verrucomicrobiota bacterium]
MRILVVEDNDTTAPFVVKGLRRSHFDGDRCPAREEALPLSGASCRAGQPNWQGADRVGGTALYPGPLIRRRNARDPR